MKRIKPERLDDWSLAVGEEIVGVGQHGDNLIFRFKSGKILSLGTESDGCGCDESSWITAGRKPEDHALLRAGAIDLKEFERRADAKRAAFQEQERAKYERLKKKFEGG